MRIDITLKNLEIAFKGKKLCGRKFHRRAVQGKKLDEQKML